MKLYYSESEKINIIECLKMFYQKLNHLLLMREYRSGFSIDVNISENLVHNFLII